MELKCVMKTARSVTVEIADGGKYITKKKYLILIDGTLKQFTNKVITSVYGLKPNTTYSISIVEASVLKTSVSEAHKSSEETDIILAEIFVTTDLEFVTLNVREFGAKGDGIQDATRFIQAAIMACPAGGRVLIPKGTYKVSSLFLKSHIRMEIAEGAELLADNDRWNYPILPGMIESYDEKEEYNLGSWEGNPLPMFSGIITGIDVEDVILYGEGSINGNASHENWWHNEKVMVGAFRPRMLFLNRCKDITVQGLYFHHSPAWVIHPYFSNKLHFCDLVIENPADSPNTDGLNPESCCDVVIEGIGFSLGDDCIAVKSGKIYMGSKYKTPSENIHIRQCLMENGHGAVTVGSEMAGGVNHLFVEECLFRNTDRGLRIKTRRGRGKDGILDNIIFHNIEMNHVMTPFVVNCFYFCDPDGKSEYVQSREVYPVDEGTPVIKRLEFRNIKCSNCHVAAAYFEGLPELKIEEISMEQVRVTYAEDAKKDVPAMSNGVKSCSKHGIYAGNIKKLILNDVVIEGQEGEPFELYGVDEIEK